MIGIGVIGAGSMVAERAVLPAIDECPTTRLVAASSASGRLATPWQHVAADDYDAIIDHPDVDAVYVPLPNGLHEHWVLRAAAAGKHVLCEKPLAPSVDAAERMRAACDDARVLLAEAWMTPFDPRWAETMRLAETGLIGNVVEVRTAFSFTIGPDRAANYRWDPAQGGGALLDVGIYCLGPAVRLWGASPSDVTATCTPAATGVDAATTAALTWGHDRTARICCSFVDDERQRLELIGTDGALVLEHDAHTGGPDARDISYRSLDGTTSTVGVTPGDPYLAMIGSFAAAVQGEEHWERPVEESIEMLRLIETIRASA